MIWTLSQLPVRCIASQRQLTEPREPRKRQSLWNIPAVNLVNIHTKAGWYELS